MVTSAVCEDKKRVETLQNHANHIDRHGENYTTVYSIQYIIYASLQTEESWEREKCVTGRTQSIFHYKTHTMSQFFHITSIHLVSLYYYYIISCKLSIRLIGLYFLVLFCLFLFQPYLFLCRTSLRQSVYIAWPLFLPYWLWNFRPTTSNV